MTAPAQLGLGLAPTSRYERPTPEQAFAAWLERYRWVYEKFVDLAFEAKRAGCSRMSARLIAERLRWEFKVVARMGEDEPALNNNHVPFMARKAMADHGDLFDFFATRERDSEAA